MNRFSLNFQDMWDLVQGTFCNILGMFRLTLCIQDFFHFFSGESVSVSNITKTGEWIFMRVSRQFIYETRDLLENFEDVAFNPLDPASTFLFSES